MCDGIVGGEAHEPLRGGRRVHVPTGLRVPLGELRPAVGVVRLGREQRLELEARHARLAASDLEPRPREPQRPGGEPPYASGRAAASASSSRPASASASTRSSWAVAYRGASARARSSASSLPSSASRARPARTQAAASCGRSAALRSATARGASGRPSSPQKRTSVVQAHA